MKTLKVAEPLATKYQENYGELGHIQIEGILNENDQEEVFAGIQVHRWEQSDEENHILRLMKWMALLFVQDMKELTVGNSWNSFLQILR